MSVWQGWLASAQETLSSAAEDVTNKLTVFGDSLAVQAEAASLEIEKERLKVREENERKSKLMSAPNLMLPWETKDESLGILSQELMEQILSLSLCDENLSTLPQSDVIATIPFDLDSYVPVIMRILQMDSNLAALHAKLTPKMDEVALWRNYYQRVQYLRAKIGIDGREAQMGIGQEPLDKVICRFKIKTAAVAGGAAAADGGGGDDEKSGSKEEASSSLTATSSATAASPENTAACEKRQQQAALAAEVEAEIGDDDLDLDLDLDGLDMDGLELGEDDDDLEDLDDIDIGNGGVSGIDSEIARELEFGSDEDDEEVEIDFEDA